MRARFLHWLLCSARVQKTLLLVRSYFLSLAFFFFCCPHRRKCWYVVLISTPRVASPPLTHAFPLCLLKSGTQSSPFSVSLFQPPSLFFAVNESLEHNYPRSLSFSSPSDRLPLYQPPRLSLSRAALSPPLMARGRSLRREQLLKYLLICFPQFYLFPSPHSCPASLSPPPHPTPLPSPPAPPPPRYTHLCTGPRNASSAVRCQRRRKRMEGDAMWRGLKIHNMRPLFSVCCARRFYLCKQNKTGWAAEGVRMEVNVTAADTRLSCEAGGLFGMFLSGGLVDVGGRC